MKNKEIQKVNSRKHYDKNKAKYRASAKRSKLKLRLMIQEIKESKPCKDCGKWYPYYVMQFDHLKDKEFNIATNLKRGRPKILKEIEKCDLVCANCHFIRTHFRYEDSRY